jgi:hypothetical protein
MIRDRQAENQNARIIATIPGAGAYGSLGLASRIGFHQSDSEKRRTPIQRSPRWLPDRCYAPNTSLTRKIPGSTLDSKSSFRDAGQ